MEHPHAASTNGKSGPAAPVLDAPESPPAPQREVIRTIIVCAICRKCHEAHIAFTGGQIDAAVALQANRDHAAATLGWTPHPVPEDPNGMRCNGPACEAAKVCPTCLREFPDGMPLSHGMQSDPCQRIAPGPQAAPVEAAPVPAPTPAASYWSRVWRRLRGVK